MREEFLGFEQHVTWGRGGEREVDHGVNVHALHLKNHAVDRHAKDFGIAELVKVVLEHCGGVESIAMSRGGSPSTACSLCGRSFRDPTHLKGLDTIIQIVASLRKLS